MAIDTFAAAIAITFLACGPSTYRASPADLPARASFDLNCPTTELRQHRLDESTYGVVGCGRRATYVSSCNGQPGDMTTQCRWIMNGEGPVAGSVARDQPDTR
jgi:hypothetical protein